MVGGEPHLSCRRHVVQRNTELPIEDSQLEMPVDRVQHTTQYMAPFESNTKGPSRQTVIVRSTLGVGSSFRLVVVPSRRKFVLWCASTGIVRRNSCSRRADVSPRQGTYCMNICMFGDGRDILVWEYVYQVCMHGIRSAAPTWRVRTTAVERRYDTETTMWH